ncbi:MAG: substrate-binding domain-containing protein [Burkholderiales bacterium]|nr:substrate-binding domain-containing protein [Burkholderiales bacterium]
MKTVVSICTIMFVMAIGVGEGYGADAPALQALSGAARQQLEKTIAAAEKEGRVDYTEVVMAAETADALAAAFRKHYGLNTSFLVNYTHAGTTAAVTRIDQEIAAKRVRTDVASISVPTWVFGHAKAGNIMEYQSPEYKHYRRAFDLKLGKEGFFVLNGGYFFVPVWDATRLNFNGKSWKDVVGAVPNGRLAIGNAETSLSVLATYVGVRELVGVDFFKALAKMKPAIVSQGELAHDRVVTGQDLMSLWGQATHVKLRNSKGAQLKLMIPEEGLVLLPQMSFILADAPHPNAAKLWLDFMLSKEGQAIITAREALVSGREGAGTALAGYDLTLERVKAVPINWEALSEADLKRAREEWISIFKQ